MAAAKDAESPRGLELGYRAEDLVGEVGAMPEMASFFPHFEFPDGRAKYFSRRNTRVPERGRTTTSLWTHSFIQNSSREMLMEHLEKTVHEETPGGGGGGAGGGGVGGIVVAPAVRGVTVGGVRLDKIVMKPGALSKNCRKTSKMLRGAEMRKGRVAGLEEMSLRKS